MFHKLSVVIPVFNEAEIIPTLADRLLKTLNTLHFSYEVIFVDDGSDDEGARLLANLSQRESNVRVLKLSRNFGHQAAVTAGLEQASGDGIVLMDGDLQDIPEAIPDFVQQWEAGFDVVYAIRTSRKENWFMQFLFKFFYSLVSKISGVKLPLNAGIFCLMDRKVCNVLTSLTEHGRYFPGLRAYAGFRQTGIPIDRDARFAGNPHVKFRGLVQLALDAIFSFSNLPLRLATYLGTLVASCSFLYLAVVLCIKIFTSKAISGWASILGAVLLLGGIQLVMLGVVGEYIGRIYEETKRRPYFVVAEKLNFPQDS